MAKAELWMIVKDLATTRGQQQPVQKVTVEEPDFYDGPVSPRVAVLDFDPDSGALTPGVRCIVPPKATGHFAYVPQEPPKRSDIDKPEFIATSVFATVHKTIQQFEQPDVLGRRVSWAFPGPQLLVVPRAGEWENAFYERASRSLQFFYFADRSTGRGRIHTALSADIVAHETTHAIVDGVAPDLYGALSPESLALHEAIADLGALSIALETPALQRVFFDKTGGDLSKWNAFSGLAQQFAAGTSKGSVFLRDLANDFTMDDVGASDPHELSQVLTGAMYGLWRFLFELYAKAAATAHPKWTRAQVAGSVLWQTREIYERMAFRALDYLPPGEATFADFARAVLAADEAGNPDFEDPRTYLRKAFVDRRIVGRREDLEVPVNFVAPAVERVDPDELLESDYAAYAFASDNRRLLGIPPEIPFKVLPRLATEKVYFHRIGTRRETVGEVLFKVSWTEEEPQSIEGLPPTRCVVAGTTLAIDRATRRVRVLLTTGKDGSRRQGRNALLRRLVTERRIALGDEALDVSGLPRRDVVCGIVVDGALRLRNTAHLLHVCPED